MALTSISANTQNLQVTTSSEAPSQESSSKIFNQIMGSVSGVEQLQPAKMADTVSTLAYNDEQINRYIDYQSTQLHPLFHISFKDWWAQGGITAPHQEPWIRETAANALRASDVRAEFNASRGLPPPERPWEGDFMAELVSKREAYAGLIEADQSSTVRTTVGAGADMSKPWNPYVSVSDGLQYSRKYSLSEVAEMRNMVSDHYSKPDEVATLMQQKAYSVQDLALATRQTINQVQSFLAQANWMHSNIAASSAPVSTTPTTPVNALQTPGDPAVPNSPPAKVEEPESAATQSQAILATPYEIDKNENAAVVVQDPVKPISDVVVSQIQDLWKNRAKPEVVSDFMNLHGLMLEDLARVTDLSTAQLQEMWLTNRS